jgi:predicted glycoside hydrolase/deacetylase ChbG (UPF0249 family)
VAICLCVDDFGLHEGIDAAALELARMGRAQAIGCLVGGASWPHGSAQLRRERTEDIDVGLHLDLTERPLLPDSRHELVALLAAAALRRLDRDAVRAEIRCQLTAFEQAIGRAPAFVDGHQHVHQFPVVRHLLVDELSTRYRGSLPWLRSTRRTGHDSAMPPRDWHEHSKPWLIERLGAAGMATLARRHGFAQNRHLLGVYDFNGGVAGYRVRLAAWLARAVDGDLLMCHPSLPCVADDRLLEARQAEFEVLGNASFDEMLQSAGVTLQPMSRILARTHRP